MSPGFTSVLLLMTQPPIEISSTVPSPRTRPPEKDKKSLTGIRLCSRRSTRSVGYLRPNRNVKNRRLQPWHRRGEMKRRLARRSTREKQGVLSTVSLRHWGHWSGPAITQPRATITPLPTYVLVLVYQTVALLSGFPVRNVNRKRRRIACSTRDVRCPGEGMRKRRLMRPGSGN